MKSANCFRAATLFLYGATAAMGRRDTDIQDVRDHDRDTMTATLSVWRLHTSMVTVVGVVGVGVMVACRSRGRGVAVAVADVPYVGVAPSHSRGRPIQNGVAA